MINKFRQINAKRYISNLHPPEQIDLIQVIERDLPFALLRGEFFLVYQPIVDIFRGSLESYEALIRWKHPDIGIISPSLFIPIAENMNLITAIDLWVLQTVLDLEFDGIPVHVNVSGHDLSQVGFVQKIDKLLAEKKHKVIIEFTETAQIHFSAQLIADIKALGVTLAVDDFGTGYSSMYLLNTLKVNLLKIDIHFIQNMLLDIDSAVIVESIIHLAHSLNMEVIAEGVETVEQLHHLYRIGCRLIQGFYISKPLHYQAIREFTANEFKLTPLEKYVHDNEDFKARVENKSRIMIELDTDLNFVRLTDNFSTYLGYDVGTLNGKRFYDLVSPEDKDYFTLVFDQLKTNHYIDNVVLNLVRRDWTLRSTLFTARYNYMDSDSIIIYLEDYTFYQEKLSEIGGVYNAYSLMFHEAPLATIVWNSNYSIIDWNVECEKTFGWTKEEAVSKNVVKLLTPNNLSGFYQSFEDIFTHKKSDALIHNIKKDGSQIICRWTNRTMLDPKGNVQFILSMVSDITDNLIKSDNIKLLSAAIDKSGSAVIVTDDRGIIEYTNERFKEITGYADGLIHKNINTLSSHEQPDSYYKHLWHTISNQKTWTGNFHNRKSDGGSYWCTSTITPIKSDLSNTLKYVCIQDDLTASNQRCTELSHINLELQHLDHLMQAEHIQNEIYKQVDLALTDAQLPLKDKHDILKVINRQPSIYQTVTKKPFDLGSVTDLVLSLIQRDYESTCNVTLNRNGIHRVFGPVDLMKLALKRLLTCAIADLRNQEIENLGSINIEIRKNTGMIHFDITISGTTYVDSVESEPIANSSPLFTDLELVQQILDKGFGSHLDYLSDHHSNTYTFALPSLHTSEL